MQNRKLFLAASLPDVAAVLYDVIAGYAWPDDYEWKPIGSVVVVDLPVFPQGSSTVATIGADRRRLTFGTDEDNRTTVFVASSDISDGCWRWTIAWKWTANIPASIGVGITTGRDHYRRLDGSTFPAANGRRAVVWTSNVGLVHYAGQDDDLQETTSIPITSASLQSTGFVAADGAVAFLADPTQLQIKINCCIPTTDSIWRVFMTASTPAEFWSMRPFVAGRVAADVCIISEA